MFPPSPTLPFQIYSNEKTFLRNILLVKKLPSHKRKIPRQQQMTTLWKTYKKQQKKQNKEQ